MVVSKIKKKGPHLGWINLKRGFPETIIWYLPKKLNFELLMILFSKRFIYVINDTLKTSCKKKVKSETQKLEREWWCTWVSFSTSM